jgi:hypothetical protein
MDISDEQTQARDLAFTLLREAGFEAPPINPYSVAARRGLHVVELDDLGEAAARLVPGPLPRIELNGRNPPTRRCFWLAYNVLRHVLPLDGVADEARRHRAWMAGATELMMPSDWFREIGELTDWDLYQLRHDFAFSSHEAVARRITALTRASACVFDNGELTRRYASADAGAETGASAQELKAYAEAARHGPGSYELAGDGALCRAYHLRPHRSRWQRIVVLSFPRPA